MHSFALVSAPTQTRSHVPRRAVTSPPEPSLLPTIWVALRVGLALVITVSALPALLGRPHTSLLLGAITAALTVAGGLAPSRSAVTVHDRQLDLILTSCAALVGAWILLTWPATDPTVAASASFWSCAALTFLLVGTRTTLRLWPAAFAWLAMGSDGGAALIFALLGICGATVGILRCHTYRLSRSELGLPSFSRALPWVAVITVGAGARGWGFL